MQAAAVGRAPGAAALQFIAADRSSAPRSAWKSSRHSAACVATKSSERGDHIRTLGSGSSRVLAARRAGSGCASRLRWVEQTLRW